MIEAEEKSEIDPLCPYCEGPIKRVWYREVKSAFGRRYLYFCPSCRKSLSISHRKGFWMG